MSISDLTIWPTVKLSQLLENLESGSRPRGGVGNIEEGVPSIGAEHVTDSGSFSFSNIKYIPDDFFHNLTYGVIQINDILVVKDGATTGKTAFVQSDFPYTRAAINEHIFLLRVKRQLIDPEYLFYFILSPWGQFQIQRNFQGAAIGGINSSFVKRFDVPVPTLPEQRRITSILRAANSLVQQTEKSLDITAKLYKSLFYAYFGTGDPIQRDSQTVKLSKLLSTPLANGYSPNTRDYPPGIAVLGLSAITDFGIDYVQIKYYPDEAYKGRGDDLKLNDILITRSNTEALVGKVARYQGDPTPVIYSDLMIRIRLKNPEDSPYIENFLRSQFIRATINRLARGTSGSMKKISQSDINDFDILWPLEADRKKYIELVHQIDRLRHQQLELKKALGYNLASLLGHIFTGQLTLKWVQERYADIEIAAAERDIILGLSENQPIPNKEGEISSERLSIARTLTANIQPMLQQLATNTSPVGETRVDFHQQWADQMAALIQPVRLPAIEVQPIFSDVFRDILLRQQEQFAMIADSYRNMVANVAATVQASTKVYMDLANNIVNWLEEWPPADHARYDLVANFNRQQKFILIICEQQEAFFTVETIQEKLGTAADAVRRNLELFASLGLISKVNLPAQSSAGITYTPAYRYLNDDDEVRLVDLTLLEEKSPL